MVILQLVEYSNCCTLLTLNIQPINASEEEL